MKKTTLCLLMATLLGFGGTAYAAPVLQMGGNYDIANKAGANAWLEIDLEAFERNITRLQKELSGNSQICAVVKADAYGHGVDLLMPSIIKLDVPCIGVASNDEARVARHHGYAGRIARVRLASIDEMAAGAEYEIEELVGNFVQARALNDIAKKNDKPIAVHIALNSGGMDRNGLDLTLDSGKASAVGIAKLSHLKTVGIMSHFANEDEDFMKDKLAIFEEQAAWLIKNGKLKREDVTLHIANSFATIRVPDSHLDMVRVGGLIYGDTVDANPAYEPTMTFKSRVASVQFYPKGTTVGYDGTFTLQRDSYLANLPFGYSDGYRRAFTNKGVVLIQGARVPVIGKVSMNTTMVDVTDLIESDVEVASNDEVVIYGKQGDRAVTQGEIEDINGALLADLYTVWGNSNPRFIKKPEVVIDDELVEQEEPVEEPEVDQIDNNQDE